MVLVSAGWAQSGERQRIDELTVERINVVDANGTLRLVMSNKDRMHPGAGIDVHKKMLAIVVADVELDEEYRCLAASGRFEKEGWQG